MTKPEPLWQPEPAEREQTLLAGFQKRAREETGLALDSYKELHRWSINAPGEFWSLAWDFCGLRGSKGDTAYVAAPDPLEIQFFPNAQLNVVDSFLKNPDDRDAVVFHGEDGHRLVWSRARLKQEVTAIAAALRAEGISKGDHVVGYVPNMPQTVAAMLATAAIGAIWSSCAPESGPDVVVDRFGQIAPKIMFAADGYFFNGKQFNTRHTIAEVAARIPSIRKTIVWGYAQAAENLPQGMVNYNSFLKNDVTELQCEPMGFRDPLYIMFSSGTTGKPKCIEHSGGGTLLRLLTEHQLHSDIRAGDRILYYTTCNWMMWNWLIAALASEATIILFDGSPMYPNISRLFDIVDTEKATHLGVSAKFIDASLKRANQPVKTHALPKLRVVLSTGSPLSPDGFEHVYSDWKSDVQLASICGGTDILGAFVGGCPTRPVYRGEIQCATLGLDIATLNEEGQQITHTAGELVCRNAHPSMPTRFLNDPNHTRYKASYFETYPNIWRQGDFTIQTEHDGFVVLGRSDATLNPGGVRIGTAEIYRQLDKIEHVLDAVVVGQSFDNDVRVVLFVTTPEHVELDDTLIMQIKSQIRKNASPRHVPAKIIKVAEIPHTKSGKVAELAVRDIVNGQPLRNSSGLANPQSLKLFENHPDLAH
ncbi:acetoacetate--CoA ligase [Cochlodiniinecator piscidefendens]|uniref:acetoacetate--CoA ligase n=1 Tax=Cochlodiniinecator piscidefendens TaxID=2715756 RepID=UPI00140DB5CF|nr:acetoacetate--CoA ligase [Cochlodiniinecator piscidefendens]